MNTFTLPIRHCSDRDFLDSFRSDLAQSKQHVIILSPFLSQNRAIHYYPALLSLTAREVAIDVYARPQSGQPEGLRGHFAEVERSLQRVGARLHLRHGMHEKIGVIDSRILWHGSLNILSHNDTKESMLRFESPELAQEVLLDLGIKPDASGRQSTLPTLDGNDAADESSSQDGPRCPRCGRGMLLFENAGMWICQESPACAGTLPLTEAAIEAAPPKPGSHIQELNLQCPICSANMRIMRGVSTRVVCPSSDCNFALDRRLAASILRILNRRKAA